jgi:hypothetical protein
MLCKFGGGLFDLRNFKWFEDKELKLNNTKENYQEALTKPSRMTG